MLFLYSFKGFELHYVKGDDQFECLREEISPSNLDTSAVGE